MCYQWILLETRISFPTASWQTTNTAHHHLPLPIRYYRAINPISIRIIVPTGTSFDRNALHNYHHLSKWEVVEDEIQDKTSQLKYGTQFCEKKKKLEPDVWRKESSFRPFASTFKNWGWLASWFVQITWIDRFVTCHVTWSCFCSLWVTNSRIIPWDIFTTALSN